jgi:hypothetical protein
LSRFGVSARFLAVAVAALVLVLSTSRARSAEPTASDKALAESLFQSGRQLMEAGKLAQACPKFQESYRLARKLGTLLNLATCHEAEGKTASAWAEFTEAEALATTAGQAERAQYARLHMDRLSRRLSTIVVEVPSPVAGIEVRLDGKVLGPAAFGTPVSVDPGEHKVEATAPGRTPWERSISIGAGPSSVRCVLPALGEATSSHEPPVRPPALATVSPPPVPPEKRDAEDGSMQRNIGIVTASAGAIGLGFGAYFGVRTFSSRDEAEPHCHEKLCDQDGVDLRESAKTSATISTVAFAAGAVAVVVGVVLVATSGRRSAAPRAVAEALLLRPPLGAGYSSIPSAAP